MAFLKNGWYCAGWSDTLTDKPKGIRMLDQEIVIYRQTGGRVAALSGICPHRFAPLALGRVKGDRIQCGYHGLEYDGTGACVRNPHGKGSIPPRARLNQYPAAERSGAIWVWMGDPALADPSQIINFDFVTDRVRWAGNTGYLKIKANYQLVIDNLLDLSHGAFLHARSLGLDAEELPDVTNLMGYAFKDEGDVIHSNTRMSGVPMTPAFLLFCEQEIGDLYLPMALHLPSNLILDLSFTPRTGPVARRPSVHLLTPESEDTTHYFYSTSRNLRLDDQMLTNKLAELVEYAFTQEDEPMVRACYEMMGGKEFFSLTPAVIEPDVAALHTRKKIAELIQKESAQSAAAPR